MPFGSPFSQAGSFMQSKAVTYHNLVIRRIPKGLAVNIVFDV